MKFGQRGIAIIGPVCHLMAFIVLALHPPYPVVAVVCVFAGFGNGVLDAAWNAWIAKMESTNELMGFLHGFYGLGATVSPLVATTMINKGHLQWYYFYYVMVSSSCPTGSCHSLTPTRLLLSFSNSSSALLHSGNLPATNLPPSPRHPQATLPKAAFANHSPSARPGSLHFSASSISAPKSPLAAG